MTTPTLPDLDLFLAVARHGSFSRAAKERNLTRSAVSHAIRDLEETLGVRLFNRTTRSVAPTEVAQGLIAALSPALSTVHQALTHIDEFRDAPRGTLRLNMPRQAVRVLAAILPAFTNRYPDIHLDIVTDDGFTDIVGEGFDAGVRFGESLAMDMIAVPLGPTQRLVVVATPTYLARHPMPQHPADLLQHACTNRRFPGGGLYRWEFEKNGHEMTVAVNGPYVFDDVTLTLAIVRAHRCIGFLFEDVVADDLAAGRLVQLLADWTPAFPGYHLYYPSRRQMPRALRLFINFIRDFDGTDAPAHR